MQNGRSFNSGKPLNDYCLLHLIGGLRKYSFLLIALAITLSKYVHNSETFVKDDTQWTFMSAT